MWSPGILRKIQTKENDRGSRVFGDPSGLSCLSQPRRERQIGSYCSRSFGISPTKNQIQTFAWGAKKANRLVFRQDSHSGVTLADHRSPTNSLLWRFRNMGSLQGLDLKLRERRVDDSYLFMFVFQTFLKKILCKKKWTQLRSPRL